MSGEDDRPEQEALAVEVEARARGSSRLSVALLVAAPMALAHIERASYWPAPGADTPAASRPAARSRPSAACSARSTSAPGDTQVVCKGKVPKAPKGGGKGEGEQEEHEARRKYTRALEKNASIKRLDKTIKKVTKAKNKKKRGYVLRPSEPRIKVRQEGREEAPQVQHKLLKQCKFDSIQEAVTRLGQQRPRRDHAGRLHRAGLARGADQRPEVRRARGDQRPRPDRRRSPTVPADLPERPEPDRGDGPRPPATRRRRSRRLADRHGIPDEGRASAATSSSRARA